MVLVPLMYLQQHIIVAKCKRKINKHSVISIQKGYEKYNYYYYMQHPKVTSHLIIVKKAYLFRKNKNNRSSEYLKNERKQGYSGSLQGELKNQRENDNMSAWTFTGDTKK